MNLSTFEKNLHNWVFSAVDPISVIWMDQNAPRLETGYIGLRHTAFNKLGSTASRKSVEDVAGQGKITYVRDTEFILMMVGYYEAGVEGIFQFNDKLEQMDFLKELSESETGIALVDSEGPISAAYNIGGHTEKRSSLDLRMRFGNTVEFDIDLIETFEIDLTAKRNSAIVYNETLTIQE